MSGANRSSRKRRRRAAGVRVAHPEYDEVNVPAALIFLGFVTERDCESMDAIDLAIGRLLKDLGEAFARDTRDDAEIQDLIRRLRIKTRRRV